MNKKAMSSGVILLIIVGIIFIGWFITNNTYVTYNIIQLNKQDYVCNENNIELTPSSFTEYVMEIRPNPQEACLTYCRIEAYNYYKEKEIPFCNENNEASCECKTSIYSYYIYPLFKTN